MRMRWRKKEKTSVKMKIKNPFLFSQSSRAHRSMFVIRIRGKTETRFLSADKIELIEPYFFAPLFRRGKQPHSDTQGPLGMAKLP